MTTSFHSRAIQLKQWLAAGLLCGVIAAPFTSAAPQEPGAFVKHPAMAPGKMGRELRALELTDEQKASLRAQRDANRDANRALHSQTRTAQQALQHAALAGEDDASLQVLAVQLGELEGQGALAAAKAQRDFVAILTAEQKTKLAAITAEREARFAEGARKHSGKGEGKKAQ